MVVINMIIRPRKKKVSATDSNFSPILLSDDLMDINERMLLSIKNTISMSVNSSINVASRRS
jgi:hypothetical protein